MKKINCTVEELVDIIKKQRTFCFGGGGYLLNSFFGSKYNEYRFAEYIEGILDNSIKKHGSIIKKDSVELPIYYFEYIKSHIRDDDFIIITSINYIEDITLQLEKTFIDMNIKYCIWFYVIDYYHANENIKDIINMNSKRPSIIPKTIHWCWFGKGTLPEKVKHCIESWKRYASDYEIVCWNEENFDINSNIYVREAYAEKKWAFVSDFVRLWSIYNYGGIYLDADTEMVKSLDSFLCHKAFSGFELRDMLSTSTMGGIKGSKWFEYLLKYYDNRHFLNNGIPDLTTNNETITQMTLEKYKKRLINSYMDLGDVVLYPKEVFSPINNITGHEHRTMNTYCIHRFFASWI